MGVGFSMFRVSGLNSVFRVLGLMDQGGLVGSGL